MIIFYVIVHVKEKVRQRLSKSEKKLKPRSRSVGVVSLMISSIFEVSIYVPDWPVDLAAAPPDGHT